MFSKSCRNISATVFEMGDPRSPEKGVSMGSPGVDTPGYHHSGSSTHEWKFNAYPIQLPDLKVSRLLL